MIARSKLTSQNQISVPAEVRKLLGAGPGSTIEFDVEDGRIFLRKVGRHSFEDIRATLFPDGPPKAKTLAELKEGIAKYMREKHARR
jgi:antitoxin PrlF